MVHSFQTDLKTPNPAWTAQHEGEHEGFLESGNATKGPQGKLPLVPCTAFFELLSKSPASSPETFPFPSRTFKKPHTALRAVQNLLCAVCVHSPSPPLECAILPATHFPGLFQWGVGINASWLRVVTLRDSQNRPWSQQRNWRKHAFPSQKGSRKTTWRL